MKQPIISIIIPCYNAGRWIQATLDSVLDQQYKPLEIIVVDDGSTDDSAGIIRTHYPQVTLIQTENRGASAARNTGTEAASGKYIQYLDADDLLVSGKLQAQVKLLEETGADVAYGDWQRLVPDANGSFSPSDVVSRTLPEDPIIPLFTYFWCPPAVYLYHREIVEKIGGWNTRLPVIQDARFALDAALYGGRFARISGILAYYRDHKVGSLSKRNPMAFTQDVLTNAIEIHTWWQSRGQMTEAHKTALLGVYAQVAGSAFGKDQETFEAAYKRLYELDPHYRPASPLHYRLASTWFGYRNALRLMSWGRHVKRMIYRDNTRS